MTMADELGLPCPACRERAVARRWTGATEVDTFDDRLGGWTEHHYADACARCGWARRGVTRIAPDTWMQHRTRDERLFYSGKDELLVGSLVGDVRVRADLPPAWPAGWDVAPREDSARVLASLLARDLFAPVPITFETDAGTYALRWRPVDMARNALAMPYELARNDTWFAVLGGKDGAPVRLEVATHTGGGATYRVARLLVQRDEQWCGNADEVFSAIDAMWRDYAVRLRASLSARSALLAEVFDAVTAGIGLHKVPIEARVTGLELLAHIAPSVHADVMGSHQGAEGPEIWRGVKAHSDRATHPAQRAGWLRENRAHRDAYYLDLARGDVTVASQCDGRVMAFLDAYPPLDLVGLRARLSSRGSTARRLSTG
jgi:hypothetical protein